VNIAGTLRAPRSGSVVGWCPRKPFHEFVRLWGVFSNALDYDFDVI
jgi:hypothetical protein